jgi:hypothetical protein
MTEEVPGKKMIVTQLQVDKILPAVVESLGGIVRVPLSYFKQDFEAKDITVDFEAETDEIVIQVLDNSNPEQFSAYEQEKFTDK